MSAALAACLAALACFAALACLTAAAGAAAEPEVVTAAADALRSGWYPDEPSLTPGLLGGGTFGQVFDRPVQGQVYAQPLVADGTLLVATEDDMVYGLDAATGAVRWQRSVGVPWNSSDLGCNLPSPHVGVTGTPVIDATAKVAYFLAKTYASGESGPAVWELHAVDLESGEERPNFPVAISGEAQNLPGVSFDPTRQLQRPALLLMNGVVYAAFGGLCDYPPYEGWIAGVASSGQFEALWATSPAGASIWQAGGGLVSDGPGQILFATGNSSCAGCQIGGFPPPPGPGSAPPEDLGETVTRVAVQPDGTLKAEEFFSPVDNAYLDEKDLDLGSGAPIALPARFGTLPTPHLLVQIGKQGVVYLLDRDRLGGMGQGPEGADAAVQEIEGTGGLWGAMAAWPGDGGYLYVPSTGPGGASAGGSSGSLEVFAYSSEGAQPRLTEDASAPQSLGYGSGSPLVTSDATTAGSGLVWIARCPDPPGCEGSELRAYGAVPAAGQLTGLWSAPIGVSTRFARPDANGGRIYVGTFDGHVLGFGATGRQPIESADVSFPTTTVGQQTIGHATIRATRAIVLMGIHSDDPQFAVDASALPATLAGGQSLQVPIAFAPAADGALAAHLSIETSEAPPLSTHLSGLGLPAPVTVTTTSTKTSTATTSITSTETTTASFTTTLTTTTTVAPPFSDQPAELAGALDPQIRAPGLVALSGVRVVPGRITRRWRRRHTPHVLFRLSAAATVRIVVSFSAVDNCPREPGHACPRYIVLRLRKDVAGHPGENRWPLALHLRAGRYRVSVSTVSRTGVQGAPREARFATG